MRRHPLPEQKIASTLGPKSHADWRQLGILAGYAVLVVVFIVSAFLLRAGQRKKIENNWQGAVATIVDVRTRTAMQVNSQYGGAMLYDVQVFVRYNAGGIKRERWITSQRPPETQSNANFDAFRWKGKQCFVRWKASDPDRVIAEVN